MGLKLSNNAISRLSASLAAGGLSLSVIPGEGSRFPTLSTGEYFPLTLIRASDGAIEIVRVTARSSDVMTIQRAKESTSALSFAAGDRVELRLTAGTMEEFREEVVTINEATHAAPSKTPPSDADEFPIADSAASYILKKLTFANLKAALKTYFDTLYQAVGSYISPGAITSSGLTQATGKLLGRTSAGSGAIEEITVSGSLSLAGGVLTVTVPVTSVGGQTGAITAQQLLDAIKTVDGSLSGLDADTLDGQHASAFAPVSHSHAYLSADMGHDAQGSLCFAGTSNATLTVVPGSTIAGSSLRTAEVTNASGASLVLNTSDTLTGTWRALGQLTNVGSSATNHATLFQRIA